MDGWDGIGWVGGGWVAGGGLYLPTGLFGVNTHTISCQLIRPKINPTFCQLKHLIEHTVALIQQVDNVEQCNDIKFPQSKRMM